MAKFFRLFLAVGVIAFMGHTPLAQADNDFWLSQKIAAGAPT
jgi:hypothetical protein